MKRVIAVLGDKVVMEESLNKAIQGVLGENTPINVQPEVTPSQENTPTNPDVDTIKEQIDQIRSILDDLEKQLNAANKTSS